MTLAERLRIPGLDPRRADLAVAGSVLLDTLLKKLGAKELTLCDLALREGLALDYIRKNQARIAKVEKYPDVRRRSVIELAERCNYSRDHAEQVMRMALTMFDQTQASHGLGTREREWLEYAAVLHDIGIHISYGRHHKHSYYLVKNGGLRGFEPQEVEVMALATRYHRRGVPKRSHEGYAELSSELRRTVKTLAAFLRVAEGLDRSHQHSVAALEIVPGGQDYLLRIKPAGDTELELWAAQRSVAPLEGVLRRIIRFEVITPPARRRKTTARKPRATPQRGQRRRLPKAGTRSTRKRAERPGTAGCAPNTETVRLSVLVSLSTAVLVPLAAPVYGQQPDLVKPDAVVKRVADGFGFLEGPTADSQGKHLLHRHPERPDTSLDTRTTSRDVRRGQRSRQWSAGRQRRQPDRVRDGEPASDPHRRHGSGERAGRGARGPAIQQPQRPLDRPRRWDLLQRPALRTD